MPTDKINVWGDPRVHLRSAHLNGRTYGYLYAPAANAKGTVFLIHGFPDLSMGWRYQIPLFLSMNYTVVVPDCMGYGRTDAPHVQRDYGYKRVADDLAELARQLHVPNFILGGHDWGGAIVYRVAQYYPQLVSHVFSICTPFFVPNVNYEPLHLLVNKERGLPNFRYQEHFASGEIEERLQSKEEIKWFLNGLFGGSSSDGKVAFDAEGRVDVELLPRLEKTPLLSEEELDYYATEYARHGLRGPLTWYRNREVNWEDEWEAWFERGRKSGQGPKIKQETLFVLATKDQALKPFMAAKMEERIPRLTRREVAGGHWILWQKSEECNKILKEWIEEKAEGKSKSKL